MFGDDSLWLVVFPTIILGLGVIAAFIWSVYFDGNRAPPARTSAEPPEPQTEASAQNAPKESLQPDTQVTSRPTPLRVLYATTTGTAARIAKRIALEARALSALTSELEVSLSSLDEYDQDNLEKESMVILVLPTWEGGKPPATGAVFCRWLQDMALDFRVGATWLADSNDVAFAVCGLGHSDFDEDWCRAALEADAALAGTGARRLVPALKGDSKWDMESQVEAWKGKLWPVLLAEAKRRKEVGLDQQDEEEEEDGVEGEVGPAEIARLGLRGEAGVPEHSLVTGGTSGAGEGVSMGKGRYDDEDEEEEGDGYETDGFLAAAMEVHATATGASRDSAEDMHAASMAMTAGMGAAGAGGEQQQQQDDEEEEREPYGEEDEDGMVVVPPGMQVGDPIMGSRARRRARRAALRKDRRKRTKAARGDGVLERVARGARVELGGLDQEGLEMAREQMEGGSGEDGEQGDGLGVVSGGELPASMRVALAWWRREQLGDGVPLAGAGAQGSGLGGKGGVRAGTAAVPEVYVQSAADAGLLAGEGTDALSMLGGAGLGNKGGGGGDGEDTGVGGGGIASSGSGPGPGPGSVKSNPEALEAAQRAGEIARAADRRRKEAARRKREEAKRAALSADTDEDRLNALLIEAHEKLHAEGGEDGGDGRENGASAEGQEREAESKAEEVHGPSSGAGASKPPVPSSSSSSSGIVDLEDVGAHVAAAADAAKVAEERAMKLGQDSRPEMVTPSQRAALTKEGYKLIGSHSAVKLCRWTKHHLRGRGGCYKHTAYDIKSYQCMEMTPSLSCASMCTFCWRHGKNPVGREWRWKTDEPGQIVEDSIRKHVDMIKEARGMPGMKMDRWHEAHTVKHCALSLVGEPIMYPKINELCAELHKRGISSFLVTNAYFPEAIARLHPVTQLYVSIDASNKEALRAVDRPLFSDFWERFLACLRLLREKHQRTVYRMTLVRKWNMADAEGYCELVRLGKPDLIEVKGVTYSGKSGISSLTMKNVPFHAEVRGFCRALSERLGGEYELAVEHEHSNFVLLAHKRFKIKGRWHTWIDYGKFHDLYGKWKASGGEAAFTTMDYIAPTEGWALYGAEEQGFDPKEIRFRRTKDGGAKKERLRLAAGATEEDAMQRASRGTTIEVGGRDVERAARPAMPLLEGYGSAAFREQEGVRYEGKQDESAGQGAEAGASAGARTGVASSSAAGGRAGVGEVTDF